MAEIIIKKKIDLAFLGEDYADSFLTFRAIAVRDFPKILKQLEETDKEDDLQTKLDAMLKVLGQHFVEGIFDKEKVSKDDLGQFNQEVIMRAFEKLTGQDITAENPIDPKGETQ